MKLRRSQQARKKRLATPPWWGVLRGGLLSGGWSNQVTASTRRSLRWFLVDGALANLSDTVLLAYQSIYLLALGATRGEIGLLGSLSNLAMPLAMPLGAQLAARSRRYKGIVISLSILGRLALLGLIFLPYFSSSLRLVMVGIGFLLVRAFLLNLLNPAWTALVGTLVPGQWRGRYFSTRNILMGLTAFVAVLGIGELIDQLGKPLGYQVAFGIALVAGLGGTAAFARIEEPHREPSRLARGERRAFWQALKKRGHFLAFCAVATLWNLSVQIAGPFFTPYLVEEVNISAATIGLLTAAATLAALPGQRLFGMLNDHKSPRWIQRLTGFIIPLVPAVWGFINRPWQAFPVEIVSGFLWAGFNLASFNLLLELTPEHERPAFVAFYQTVVGLGMAAGAALGGLLAQRVGYRSVFLASAGGRWVAALLFALLVARTRPAQIAPEPV